jgi:hypothetical protein
MKSRSAKAKGRRAVAELRDILLEAAPELEAGDLVVNPTSLPGEDLYLSPRARSRFPWAIEVKNVERLNVWDALSQAENHGEKSGGTPALFFKRNRSDFYVALKLRDFLRLVR